MKILCKYCNNANKINEKEYICCGGKKDQIEEYEKQAKELKKWVYINKCWVKD